MTICALNYSFCSLTKPPFLSTFFLYSVTYISLVYVKLANFGIAPNSSSVLLSINGYFSTQFYQFCLCNTFQFLSCLCPQTFFFLPLPLHRSDRTDFLCVFRDTHMKNQYALLIPSRVKWNSPDLIC